MFFFLPKETVNGLSVGVNGALILPFLLLSLFNGYVRACCKCTTSIHIIALVSSMLNATLSTKHMYLYT